MAAPRRPLEEVAGEFQNWTERYLAASAAERPSLIAEGEKLARERRDGLKQIIPVNPERALELAVPVAMRSQLPTKVQMWLEERVSGRGDYAVWVVDDFEQGHSETHREVTLDGRTFDAFVYGARYGQVTTPNLVLHGIAVDNQLAVHEQALRPVEAGEAVPAGAGICPVSQQPSTIHQEEAVAQVGPAYEKFCGVAHLELYNAELLAGDTGGSKGGGVTNNWTWTQGVKTILYIPCAYADKPDAPITTAAANSLMDQVNQYFTENSYGSLNIVGTVTPLIILPHSEEWYLANGYSQLRTDARNAAKDLGYDYLNYDLDAVRYNGGPGSFGGLASVGGRGCWLKTSALGTTVHEFGHNLGVWHANFWVASSGGNIGPGLNSEYGNSFDVMGSSGSQGQFNAAHKSRVDWLPEGYVTKAATSGSYRIRAFDVPTLTAGEKYSLRIHKDYLRDYWLEHRQKSTNNAWQQNGVMLNWNPWSKDSFLQSSNGTQLIDFTPGTPAGNSSKDDAPVVVGQTFSDFAAGVHITPTANGGTGVDKWIDVLVQIGDFTNNLPPTGFMTVNATNGTTATVFHFTATANDPEGDPLAYFWDFGDQTFGPNAPAASKLFAANGEYAVRCTVSDTRGGRFSQTLVVRVGSPSVFRITGVIADAWGNPVENVRVHNGGSGAAYRGTYTDSDGTYDLVNLSAGNVTVSAVKYGWSFTPSGFANPVAVGPSQNGCNFAATAMPVVRLDVADAFCSETGTNAGQLIITRTGPTDAPLTVYFNRSGNAAYTTDYTFDPAPVSGTNVVVIPIGSSTATVAVNPVNDATGEGTEFVTITLKENDSYLLGFAEQTLELLDNDTLAKPTVSLTASSWTGDNAATESGNDIGAVLVTRSGNISSNLTVFYTVSGTGTSGTDFVPLSGSLVIPTGSATNTIELSAIDDALVEGTETVVITLAANSAYTTSGSAATVNLIDDDPLTVTVTATDLDMAEPSNAGTFRLQRSGSLAANLTVFYNLAGTAVNGTDYTTNSGSITFPAGTAAVNVALTPINDTALEGDETVTLNLVGNSAYNVGNPASATIVLVDNELPTITVTTSGGTSVTESNAAVVGFSINRGTNTLGDLTVNYTLSGNAINGEDFAPLAGSVVITNGLTNAFLRVTPVDDTLREAAEIVRLQLLADPAYNVGTATPTAITINDNDTGALPGLGFFSAALNQLESITTVRLPVDLSATVTSTSTVVSVDYAVTGGTATGGGTDYTLASGTLIIPPGSNNLTLTFNLVNDTTAESDETIVITLSNPTNAVLDAHSDHTLTILDDDAHSVTVASFVANATETGQTNGVFRFTRTGATNNPLTVAFETGGTAGAPADYAPLGNSIVIPAGSLTADLPVVPVDDNTDETNETVRVQLITGAGYKLGSPSVATVNLVDNDNHAALPVITVAAADTTAMENSTNTGAFTFTRSGATTTNLTVLFSVGGTATSGSDFTVLGSNVVIPAGSNAVTLTVTPLNDVAFETTETILVTLMQSEGYFAGLPASATVNLLDDENSVSITATNNTMESSATPGAFVLARTGATTSNLTVNLSRAGTASNGLDYATIPATALIPAGEASVVIPVTPLSDTLHEGTESVSLGLSSGSGYAVAAPSNAVVLIADAPFEQWRLAKFSLAQIASLGLAGAGDDPDGDGLKNLMEYALARDPWLNDGTPVLAITLETNPGDLQPYLIVTYSRRLAPPDLSYEFSVTTNWIQWLDGPDHAEELSVTDDGNGATETVRTRIKPSISIAPGANTRLNVIRR